MIARAVTVLVATLLGVLGLALPAQAAAQRVCRVSDDRLTELSGLVATSAGYVVVNDGSDEKSHRKIFFLGKSCGVTRTVSYPSTPRDTEDLAAAADGTLWVADIGDNDSKRDSIALWRLAPGARTPVLYRMKYPDGAHNAEALLWLPSGTPVVVTKTFGAAEAYVPAAALRTGTTTPLRSVGSIDLPLTETDNPFGIAGHLVVTGGAVSPDGKHAVLRTYADAFEFEVTGGDVVGAITSGTPRQIPLPNEPQGESVAYTTDGTALLTISEGKDPSILRYALPSRPAVTSSPTPGAGASRAPQLSAGSRVAASDRIPAGVLVAGGVLTLGVATLLLVVAWRKSR